MSETWHEKVKNKNREEIIAADKPECSGLERLSLMLNSWVDLAKLHMNQMKFIILFDIYYEAYDTNEELN